MADASSEAAWDVPAKVAELRKACGAEIQPWCSDEATLRRYLRARKGVVVDAQKMLLRHQKWRSEECAAYGWPHRTIPPDEIAAGLRSGSSYIFGSDNASRPLVWVRVRFHDSGMDRSVVHRYVIHMLDEAVSRCNLHGSADTFVAIIDARDLGWSNCDTDALKYILMMLGTNYAERLGLLFIINEGFLFRTLWAVVEPFLDARTTRKIRFLGGADTHRPVLLEHIPAASLPVELGGICDYEYSFNHVVGGAASSAVAPDVSSSCHVSVRHGPVLAKQPNAASPIPTADVILGRVGAPLS